MVGNIALTKLLLQREDILVNMTDDDGNTPLHVACLSLNDKIIMTLVDQCKADTTIENSNGKTARDLLATKAKQAGKQNQFSGIIERLDNPNSTANIAGREEQKPRSSMGKNKNE